MDIVEAYRNNRVHKMERLLSEGVDPNTRYEGGTTMLMNTVSVGSEGVARLLIDKGADIDARDDRGETALMYGLRILRVVKLLLESGADVTISDNTGTTPLLRSIRHIVGSNSQLRAYRVPVVSLLLDYGADPNTHNRGSTSPLSSSLRANDAELTLLLLQKGANPDKQAGEYFPLIDMSSRGDIYNVRLLLHHGADPNIHDSSKEGSTPLIEAARIGKTGIAKLLLDNGARVNEKNSLGSTALMHASVKGETGVVRLLLDRGADTSMRDNKGKTAYDLARSTEIIDIINDANMRAASIYGNKDRSRGHMTDFHDLGISFSS